MNLRKSLNVLEKIQKSTSPFSYVPIGKEVMKIDKDGNESVVTISYKKNIIASARFMVIHYQNPVEFTKLNEKIMIVFLNIKVS